ncbi:general transcription factor II-I repeat domain-containing protein 2-like [Epinephelus fuscoguttatus]|uniref:general transcription factor II-I repeat domain-containing protein 2-like n=1 Tax=Epinephelus fuscoguttatus TaxID=293821 RepID=UPI0020CFEBF7|nr:general transcription factor II-I repeat domain-containing protein 2-like [Epinephelus fuscoguttatus]
MAEARKTKTYHFHSEWEEDYFFVYSNSKSICLICNASVSIPKKGNLERHFKTVHKSSETDFPAKTALRTRKVQELKSQLAAQQSIFTRPNTKGKAATIASYRVSHVLAKHKKSFKHGEVVKEAFIEAADALFDEFKNKMEIVAAIKDVQLSRNTVTRQCEAMTEDVEGQLKKDIDACECFSLQFDESTDTVDVAQLCVFIRMVFDDISAKEELLIFLPLKGHTRGEDVFNAFMEFVNKRQLPLFKLISITTDGAPVMVGHTSGFIALCKKSESFPDILNYLCIIHQQALCEKILNMKEVMDVAMKIVCSVRARSLQRRLFRAHLEDTGAEHTDLLLHTDVRWLSRGKFLARFSELLPEIKDFLKLSKHAEYAQLEDCQWLLDLAFLTDLTGMLNDLNLELQGQDKHVINMISSVNTFKSKLQLLSSRLHRCDLRNFPYMQAELQRQGKDSAQLDSAHYKEQVQSILSEFEKRFTDFTSIEPVASEGIDVDYIASKVASLFQLDSSAVEIEILTLQNDIEIKSRATPGMKGDFWNLMLENKYPNLRSCALNLTALFGSTYLCEAAFSHMKIIKLKHRSTMTDDHVVASLRLATSSYCPDFEKLAASSQCQRSH